MQTTTTVEDLFFSQATELKTDIKVMRGIWLASLEDYSRAKEVFQNPTGHELSRIHAYVTDNGQIDAADYAWNGKTDWWSTKKNAYQEIFPSRGKSISLVSLQRIILKVAPHITLKGVSYQNKYYTFAYADTFTNASGNADIRADVDEIRSALRQFVEYRLKVKLTRELNALEELSD